MSQLRKYPITRIEGKDTVVIMTIKQANAINRSYKQLQNQLDSLKKLCDLKIDFLTKQNDSLLTLTYKFQNVVSKTTTKVDDTTYFYYELDTRKKDKVNKFNTWSLQANLNYGYGNFDRVSNDLFKTSISSKFGFGLRTTKQLSTVASINFDLYKTNFEGVENNFTYNTHATQLSILPQLQIGNIKYLDNFPRSIFYGYVGVGVVKFNVNSSKNNVNLVIPYGVGSKYKLSENSAINLDFTFNYYLGDDLDGKVQLYSDNDTYNRFTLGYTYTFGKKSKKNLTWFNPFTDAYNKNFILLK